MTTAFIFYYWQAILITYLTSRKMTMPFSTIEDLYHKTNFRLALIPNSAHEDDFKYSLDPIYKKIYEERVKPYLQEYLNYPNHLNDMFHFIRNDYDTALYFVSEVTR